jgi:hypothetical protein
MLYVTGLSVFYLAGMCRNATSTVHIMDTNKDPTRRTRSTNTSKGGKLVVLLILSVKFNLLIYHSTQLSLSCKIGMS